MITGRAIFALLLACAAGVTSAQIIYRWTDERGNVHATDTPPPPGARNVQKQRPAGAPQGADNEPYALQLARKNAPVTFFSTPGCEPCNAARKLLNARGVPFREVSVVDDKQVEELKAAVGGNAVPSLVVGSRVQQGFEEQTYQGLLDAAGYPKAGVLPPRKQGEPQAPAPSETPAPSAEQAPTGPYAPGAPRQRPQKK